MSVHKTLSSLLTEFLIWSSKNYETLDLISVLICEVFMLLKFYFLASNKKLITLQNNFVTGCAKMYRYSRV